MDVLFSICLFLDTWHLLVAVLLVMLYAVWLAVSGLFGSPNKQPFAMQTMAVVIVSAVLAIYLVTTQKFIIESHIVEAIPKEHPDAALVRQSIHTLDGKTYRDVAKKWKNPATSNDLLNLAKLHRAIQDRTLASDIAQALRYGAIPRVDYNQLAARVILSGGF